MIPGVERGSGRGPSSGGPSNGGPGSIEFRRANVRYATMRPQDRSRRGSAGVAGLSSPRTVTETVCALAPGRREPPRIPTGIRPITTPITTEESARRAELSLPPPENGWLHRLRADRGLLPIAFGPEQTRTFRRGRTSEEPPT